MWPWEHVAVGYLAYSLGLRAVRRPPPTAASLLVLLLGTQLPDLVDKPLSWGLGWFPQGYAIAHSALVAVPLSIVAILVTARWSRPRLGVAFAVGYLSHLAGDVVYPALLGGPTDVGRILWPIATAAPYGQDYGLARGLIYLGEFLAALASMEPTELFVQLLLLPLLTIAVWIVDGAPGASSIANAVRGLG